MFKYLFIAVLLVAGAGWYYWSDSSDSRNVSPSPSATTPVVLVESASSTPETEAFVAASSTSPTLPKVLVNITDNGFEPKGISIKQGQIVEFVSAGKNFHWPASDLHPTHEIYPELDADKPLSAGESWSFKFEKVGKWGMHDHLHARFRGSVEVK